MLVLFDHGTPRGIAGSLRPHTVVLLTTDKNLRFQQNLQGRKLAIAILSNSRWRLIRRALEPIVAAVNNATPGSYTLVDIPIR